MEKEGVTVTKSLTKLKDDVEKFVENAKEAAKLLLSVTNNEEKTLHKVYKEVNRKLGFIEMKITMIRARVSSWVESPPAKQRPVPHPLHLNGEDTIELLRDGDGPLSPVHTNIASRAVQWWMEREELNVN